MSRTDNTDPHWVRATWWEPDHQRCDNALWLRTDRPCDLPAEPILNPEYGARWRLRGRCAWTPTYEGMTIGGGWGAPSWFSRVAFTAPERRRVRDQLVRARQEYRGAGEVAVVVEAVQHRHRANWDW